MLRFLSLLLIACGICSASADAAARAHDTHGTVRRLCAPALMRHWPGGPVAGRLAKVTDVRRYTLGTRQALGVTQAHRPVLRGYVVLSAFCPPSRRGRVALTHSRAIAARRGRGQPAERLAHPVLRRVCAAQTWVRDRPLNRAIALAFRGDAVLTDRRSRNPWRGGVVYGHAQRRGWVPESALCRGISRRMAGHLAVAVGGTGARVLAPPPAPSCARRIAGRRLLQVGARIPVGSAGDRLVVTARLERGRRPVGIVGAVFSGRRGRMQYAALGPLTCGRTQALVYVVRRGGHVLARLRRTFVPGRRERAAPADVALEVGGMRAGPGARAFASGAARTAAATRALATLPAASLRAPLLRTATPPAPPVCATQPGRRFAHGGRGPVDHRFHVRPALSASGRYVAFDSPGRLSPADHDNARDVYRRDTTTGAIRLVSRGKAAGKSRAPAVSSDGSVVAFESDAPDLVPGDGDGARDVFVADLATGVVRRMSDAAARTPSLSADGRRVAYELTGADAAMVVQDVRSGAILRRLSAVYRPALSGDGKLVAFETRRRVDKRDDNANWDVAEAPVAGGAARLISVARGGHSARGVSLAVSLSRDGSVAAFQSDAPGLVAGDRNGLRDVFVRDLRAHRTVRVSVDRCGGDADGYSRYPSLSADGRRVAFDSHATDLVRGDTGHRGHVYVSTVRARPRVRLADTRPNGAPSARTAFSPALSGNGHVLAFPTFGYDLGPRDLDHRVDVYTRRLPRGRAHRAG